MIIITLPTISSHQRGNTVFTVAPSSAPVLSLWWDSGSRVDLRFCEGGSGGFDGGGSSGSNNGGDGKVWKKILSDHEGNFGATSEIPIAVCRLMGRSYAQKLDESKGISGLQFGRWRWCYLGRGGPNYLVLPILIAPLLPHRWGGWDGIGGGFLLTQLFSQRQHLCFQSWDSYFTS